MIRNFKHKGLERYFLKGDRRGTTAQHEEKIRRILFRLSAAQTAEDMNLPGYRFHALKGNMKGYWSVTVSSNWRIIFRFEDNDACDVELIDYH